MLEEYRDYLVSSQRNSWCAAAALSNTTSLKGEATITYYSKSTLEVTHKETITVFGNEIIILTFEKNEFCSIRPGPNIEVLMENFVNDGDLPKWLKRVPGPDSSNEVPNENFPQTESNQFISWPKQSLSFCTFVGKCDQLRARHMHAILSLLKRFFIETGLKLVVQDLSRIGGCPNHPVGTHGGKDADFGYLPTMELNVLLWKYLFAVFPESTVQTHTDIYKEVVKIVGSGNRSFLRRVAHDTNSKYGHKGHFHFSLGGTVNWDIINNFVLK